MRFALIAVGIMVVCLGVRSENVADVSKYPEHVSLDALVPRPEPAEAAIVPPEAPAVLAEGAESTSGSRVSDQGEAMAPVASSVVQAPVLTNDIERLVCSYEWDCLTALNVMWAESGGRPDAWNDWEATANPYDGVGGLFQISVTDHAQLIAGCGGDVFDPAVNVCAAHHLWSASGGTFCRHWVTC